MSTNDERKQRRRDSDGRIAREAGDTDGRLYRCVGCREEFLPVEVEALCRGCITAVQQDPDAWWTCWLGVQE